MSLYGPAVSVLVGALFGVLPSALLLVGGLAAGAAAQTGSEQPGVLWSAGQRRQAVEVLREVVADHPDDRALRLRLAEWELAVHAYAAAAVTAAPLGRDGDHVRGPALYLLAEYEQALALLDVDDPLQCLMRLDALEALGRATEAEAAALAAAAVLGADHPELLVRAGQRGEQRGDPEAAIASYRAALQQDPLAAAALFRLGRALIQSGRREEGLEALAEHRRLLPLLDDLDFARRSVDLEPLHASNHARVGDAERALGRTLLAEAAYVRALDLAQPHEQAPITLRAARHLVEELDRLDGALALLDRAFEASQDPRLAVRAGDLLADAGRTAEAAERFRRAQELRPGDEQIAARIAALGLSGPDRDA